MNISPFAAVLLVVIGCLGVGLYALLFIRNLIKAIISLQILIKGILVAVIYAGRVNGQMDLAQSMGLTIIVADTIVAVVGLALAVQVRRRMGTLDTDALAKLRR